MISFAVRTGNSGYASRIICWLSLFLLLTPWRDATSADWLKKIFNPKLPAASGAPSAADFPIASATMFIANDSGFVELAEHERLKWNRTTPPARQSPVLLSRPASIYRNAEFDFEFQPDHTFRTVMAKPKEPGRLYIVNVLPATPSVLSIDGRLRQPGEQRSLREYVRDYVSEIKEELENVWCGPLRETTVGGATAIEFELTGHRKEHLLYHHAFAVLADNAVYFVDGHGPATSRGILQIALSELLERVRFASAPDTAPRGIARDAPVWWGIDAELAGTDWTVTESGLINELRPATQVATREGQETICVIPVTLLNHEPHQRAMVPALLDSIKFEYAPGLPTLREVDVAGARWHQLTQEVTGPENRERRNIAFTTSSAGKAYLITASFPLTMPASLQEQRLELFFSRLRLTPAPVPTRDQLTLTQRWQHAQFYNSIGVFHAGLGQFDIAVEYFREANQLDPINSTLAANLLEILLELRLYPEAISLLENPPSDIAASDRWRAERACMLASVDRIDDAVAAFDELLATGITDETVFETYLAVLAQSDRTEKAIELATDYLADNPSRNIALVQIRLLLNAERYDEAVELAEGHVAGPLGDPEFSYLLVEAYRDSDDTASAHGVIEQLRSDGFDDARTWFLKATVEIAEEQYRLARASLETVLERQPDHPEVKETLELVSNLMGQSNNTEIRNAIEPVPLPDDVRPVAVRSPQNQDASSWYGLAAYAQSFSPDQDCRRTSYGVVHLEDAAAVSEFSTLQFAFKPLAERVFVNRVDVFDRDGQLLAQGNIDDYYVQSDTTQDLATEERVVNVPVPGLKPGCRLEYVFTSERLGVPDTFPFTQHCFSRGTPVERAVMHISGDVSDLVVQGSVPRRKSAGGLTWIVDAPPQLTDEPLQVDHQKAYPTVTVAGVNGDWQKLAARYLQRLSGRLDIGPDVRELARQIANDSNAVTLAEKVVAMTAFVQRELVYQGLEFGVRGQVMPPVQQTLQRRYGDCKDHSLLLCQLLRAVDVPASLCLVQTVGPVVREIPSMEQFDHMIVFVDDGPDGWFLDGTSKGSSPEFRVPPGLAKHDALILDEAAPRLVQIPDYPAGASQIFADRQIQLEADGHALVTEVVQIKGYSAAIYRSLIRDIDLSKRDDFIRDYLAPEKSNTKPLTGSVRNLDDHSQPLVLKATYEIKELLHPTYGLLVGRLPQFLESGMVEYEEIEDRQTPFRLSYPSDVIARIRVTFPTGYSVDGSPEDVSQASPFGGLASRVTVTDHEFQILSRLTRRTGEFPAAQWRDYARFLSLAGETFAPRLLLREGPVQQASRETVPAAAGR